LKGDAGRSLQLSVHCNALLATAGTGEMQERKIAGYSPWGGGNELIRSNHLHIFTNAEKRNLNESFNFIKKLTK